MFFPVVPKACFPKGMQGFFDRSQKLQGDTPVLGNPPDFLFSPFNHQHPGPVHGKNDSLGWNPFRKVPELQTFITGLLVPVQKMRNSWKSFQTVFKLISI